MEIWENFPLDLRVAKVKKLDFSRKVSFDNKERNLFHILYLPPAGFYKSYPVQLENCEIYVNFPKFFVI